MAATSPAGSARYVFAVEFRLEPATADLAVEPAQFETRLFRRADPPGQDGWLFFRDHLWRGELADPVHFRELAAEALGVPVTAATFRELRADEAYLSALRAAIGDHLDEFRSATVDAALSKYLGSSIRVVSPDEEPDASGH